MKKPQPDSSALDELDYEPDPITQLQTNLQACEADYLQDQTSIYPAFQAINFIATYHWQQQSDTTGSVAVPWWAVEAIAAGFQNYTEAWNSGLTKSFGEAFGMEHAGQGEQPHIAKVQLEERDRDLALRVASILRKGLSVETAIAEVVKQVGLGDATIWRAWNHYGKAASRNLQNYYSQNLAK